MFSAVPVAILRAQHADVPSLNWAPTSASPTSHSLRVALKHIRSRSGDKMSSWRHRSYLSDITFYAHRIISQDPSKGHLNTQEDAPRLLLKLPSQSSTLLTWTELPMENFPVRGAKRHISTLRRSSFIYGDVIIFHNIQEQTEEDWGREMRACEFPLLV
ncbi:hypothetical protein BDV39DRAFT_199784 [Aspergillus sergii]|uniref:Uncharacterized protein n=1 Tax=Aspergillus sergii TaxID=1034303 RepID=A0A5N6XKA1_9EURO|nr:hypothetical protein BDV39DRAFT_199784 [Aspergillus sergii]